MKGLVGLGLVAVLWCVGGCSGESPEELFAAAEAAADSSSLERATEYFNTFLERYPQHERSGEALMQLAAIAQQRGEMRHALALYERLLAEYPRNNHGAEAQFMIGFICEEYLHDWARARRAYQRVIDHYPDSELGMSARHLLPHVGHAPEEWMQFQEEVKAQ